MLTYTQAASDAATVSGIFHYNYTLTVTTGAVTAIVTDSIFVMAMDPIGLAARDTLVVTVEPNVVPGVIDAIGDTTLAAGGTTAKYTLSEHFADPDGTPADLTYEASSSEPDTVSAGVNNGVLEVTPENVDKPGTATITVKATDPGGLWASTAFDVTVRRLCVISPTPIADLSLASGGYKETYTLGNHFTASNCTADLSYTGSSSKAGVALAGVSNGTLTVTSVGTGTTDITVTAKSGKVSRSIEFEVTVTQNQAPTVSDPFTDTFLTVGQKGFDATLTEHFSDPEGGPLAFSVAVNGVWIGTRNTAAVRAAISGNALTVTPRRAGSATVTVRATDQGGGRVEDEFDVTVYAGRGKEPRFRQRSQRPGAGRLHTRPGADHRRIGRAH